jgi:methionyl-tRNA formyltransferase
VKVLFLGTAGFACPTLEALLASSHEVIGVVTQPDRPRGRGQKAIPTPVKSLALKAHLPVHQPEKVRDPAFLKVLESIKPEIMVVAAYGQILSAPVLAVPPRGCVNVHGSLLPKYRGAAPIVRAILGGETRTGITTMFMDPGMDTGPILLAEETEIGEEDTAGTLHDRLAQIGARLLLRTLEGLETNTVLPKPQDPSRATLAPKIEKGEFRVRWNSPARQLFNQVRAFDPWPGAFTLWAGRILKLFRPRLIEIGAQEPPGTIVQASEEGLRVAAYQGDLLVREVQAEGRPRMRVSDFLRGNPLPAGSRLGE